MRGAALALLVAVLLVQVAVQVGAADPVGVRGPDAPKVPDLPEPSEHEDHGAPSLRGPAQEFGDRPDPPGLAGTRLFGAQPRTVPGDPDAFAEQDGSAPPARVPERPQPPGNSTTATGPADMRQTGGTCYPADCGPSAQKENQAAAHPDAAPQSRDGVVATIPAEPLARAVGAGAGVGVVAGLVIGWRSVLAGGALRVLRRGKVPAESHPVRSAVLRHVELHPGATTRELAKAADVTYRRVVYHLDMLERAQRLRVRTVGRKRLYFAADAPRVDEKALALRALADPATSSGRILARLAEQPGLSLTRIARTFGISVGNAHYHLQRLREVELVRAVRRGTRIRHYVTTAGRSWAERMAPLARAQDIPGTSTAWRPSGAGVPA